MEDRADTTLRHPAACAVARVKTAVGDLAQAPVWSMSTGETAALIGEIETVLSQVAAIEAKALHQAGTTEVAGRAGATSTANWLAHAHVITRAEAHRRVRLAAGLDQRPVTGAALGRGEVLPEQAHVILGALERVEKLPDDLAVLAAERTGLTHAELIASAEEHLLVEAKTHDAKELRILGRKILDVVCPEVGEADEQRPSTTGSGSKVGQRHVR